MYGLIVETRTCEGCGTKFDVEETLAENANCPKRFCNDECCRKTREKNRKNTPLGCRRRKSVMKNGTLPEKLIVAKSCVRQMPPGWRRDHLTAFLDSVEAMLAEATKS